MSRLRVKMFPILLAAANQPARAQGYGGHASLPGFDRFVDLIGLDSLSGGQRDLLALSILAFALGFGYVSHLGFGKSGFGVLLNGVIGVAGSCVALSLLSARVDLTVHGRSHDFLRAVLVAGAAVPTLMLAAALASLRRRATIGFFHRQSRRKRQTEHAARLAPDLPPHIAQVLKKSSRPSG